LAHILVVFALQPFNMLFREYVLHSLIYIEMLQNFGIKIDTEDLFALAFCEMKFLLYINIVIKN